MLAYFYSTTVLIFVLSSFVPLLRKGAWWIRVFDFPRLQVFYINACLLAIGRFDRLTFGEGLQSLLDILLCTALVLDGYRIIPYFSWKKLFSKKEIITPHRISVMSANVLISNNNYQSLVSNVQKEEPDIFVAIETDEAWCEKLKPLEKIYQHRVYHPKDNTYGLLFYSKLSLSEAKIEFLVDNDVPSLFCELTDRGFSFQVIVLHPRPPRPQEGPSDQRDAELMHAAKFIRHAQKPTIVMGDLNDVAWSHSTRLFLRISGLIDPRRGRGVFCTYPSMLPFLRFPLDHIFHSYDFALLNLRRLKTEGSDHFAIKADFSIRHGKKSLQPRDDAQEKEEARTMIARGKEWEGPDKNIPEESE